MLELVYFAQREMPWLPFLLELSMLSSSHSAFFMFSALDGWESWNALIQMKMFSKLIFLLVPVYLHCSL